jgi:hypothetical protein
MPPIPRAGWIAGRHDLDDTMPGVPSIDDLLADLRADLLDDAEDVAVGRRRVRSDDEVGAGQDVEMGGVVGDVEGVVEELSEHPPGARRRDLVHRIGGLGGGHVVSLRADAADPVRESRHVLDGAAYAEGLEAAQLGDLEVGVLDVPGFVEDDLDAPMTLEARDRVDADAGHERPPWSGEAARLKR